MDLIELRTYCMAKPHTTESFPFGADVLVFKVANKMFLLTDINDLEPSINLKCDPENAEELREHHPEITPGYHMNKKMWNTVSLSGRLSDDFIKEMIDESYRLVVESLPKKIRLELFP